MSYEADLFRRVASTVDAATADAQQSAALLRSVQLALQADVAQGYFLVRRLDTEQELYRSTVALRQKTLDLVQRRLAAGDIGELDVARAKSELAAALSEAFGRPFSLVKYPASFEHRPEIFGEVDEAHARHQMATLRAVHDWYEHHDFIGNGNVLRMLLGREPTSFVAFVRRHFGLNG